MPIDRRNKIGFYIEDGRCAGPHKYLLQIGKKLDELGYNISVIIPNRDSAEFEEKLKQESLYFLRCDITRLSSHYLIIFKYLMLFLPEMLFLAKKLKKLDLDLLIAVGGIWQFKGILAALLARTKIIWRFNDTSASKVFFLIYFFLANRIDAVIYNGNGVYEYYKKIRHGKSVIIQSPIDFSYYKRSKKVPIKKEVIITTIGNINPLKGYEYFIQMAEILNQRFNNLIFKIAGEKLKTQKKYIKHIKKCASNRRVKISFLGYVHDVRALLEETDIYVCTSVTEASPNSVWEAMAMEVPVVATKVGDIPYIIKNGDSGLLVENRNAIALAEAIALLIEDKVLRRAIGQKGRAQVIKNLCTDKIIKQHINLFKEI